jgi:hypothetical protein
MIEHFDNVGLILHQNQVSGARACRDGDHANDGQYVFGVQSRPKPNRGCQRCVGLVIRSIGNGNTMVELRSLAMSNNVAR